MSIAKAELVFDQSVFQKEGVLPWFANFRRQAWADRPYFPVVLLVLPCELLACGESVFSFHLLMSLLHLSVAEKSLVAHHLPAPVKRVTVNGLSLLKSFG